LLAGCPVTSIPPSRPSSHTLSEPVPEPATGPYVHAPSKVTFREVVAGFARDRILRFDSAGLDVGVGYNLAELPCGAAVTVFVAPAPRMTYLMADPAAVQSTQADFLQRYFAASRAEIPKFHPGAQILSEGPAVLRNPAERAGLKALFSFSESELDVFIFHKAWFVKYRVTYPEACAAAMSPRVAAFMAAFAWPDGA
jgi:hypothetical protein